MVDEQQLKATLKDTLLVAREWRQQEFVKRDRGEGGEEESESGSDG